MQPLLGMQPKRRSTLGVRTIPLLPWMCKLSPPKRRSTLGVGTTPLLPWMCKFRPTTGCWLVGLFRCRHSTGSPVPSRPPRRRTGVGIELHFGGGPNNLHIQGRRGVVLTPRVDLLFGGLNLHIEGRRGVVLTPKVDLLFGGLNLHIQGRRGMVLTPRVDLLFRGLD